MKTLTLLGVDKLDDDQIESIRELAMQIHTTDKYDGDIFKSTIHAVFEWISLALDDGQRH